MPASLAITTGLRVYSWYGLRTALHLVSEAHTSLCVYITDLSAAWSPLSPFACEGCR